MELQNGIDFYAKKECLYPLPEIMHGAGTVRDPESGNVLAVGVSINRDTYQKCGYTCAGQVPAELHACVCALFEMIQDMPIIKTRLLTPDMISETVCGDETATEDIKRYSAMAMAALCQAFVGYVNGQSH